jgi:hypothetical protein
MQPNSRLALAPWAEQQQQLQMFLFATALDKGPMKVQLAPSPTEKRHCSVFATAKRSCKQDFSEKNTFFCFCSLKIHDDTG